MKAHKTTNRRKSKVVGHGIQAERKQAKRLGAQLHPGSGAASVSADMTLGDFKIETKSTIHDSISLKGHWLRKVKHEALQNSQYAALSIQFVDDQGVPKRDGSWVMMDEKVFKQLLESVDGD